MPEDSPTELLPQADPLEPRSLIGRTLGKFEVIEKLGRGGSGDVYRAEQPQLGRSAVIKALRRENELSPNRVERFLREVKLASRLDHPYAAHIYAFGAEPDGLMWIAMEHVRGGTLDELIARRGPVPASVFAPLFARLCEVVHSMHELGIVHRDIKATNVMVIERSGQLLPKLIDFGIAKGLDSLDPIAEDEVTTELTGHGSTLGSPHYMSPEQWAAPSEVDARADIYALGVLAYRCLAGKLPFQEVGRMQLAEAHQHRPPPPLPASVPAALADVIQRALAKRADARWPTAVALAEATQRAVGGTTPEAVPIFDPVTRDMWMRGGPQPIADAVAHLASATTTVEADAALRELVAITCRWLAVCALAELDRDAAPAELRERAKSVMGSDDAAPWLALALAVPTTLPGLVAALAQTETLLALAQRLDGHLLVNLSQTPGLGQTPGSRAPRGLTQVDQVVDSRRTPAALAVDMAAIVSAMRSIEPLLAYQLVVGRGAVAESWQGTRRRERERVVVWGELADGAVALLDAQGAVVAVLSPLVQIISPLPSAEPELFLLWRSGRRGARLVAAPWGFERDDEAANAKLALLTTEDTDTINDAASEASPYPGLAAYRSSDASRFVGREREIETLANRLVRAPMLAVLGPSGAGKSSFIHAGVVPRLAEHSEIITMRPGRHPLHALASLPPVHADTEDSEALVRRLRELGEKAPRGLVIVVDQLEELVTLCGDPREREAFARTLARAADGPDAPVRVVVTLRDDFASVIESEDAFRGRFEVFVLAAPAPEALRRIVIEPARRMGVAVEPEVVDAMVAAVVGRPASLPLLSFTASQLWATRERGRITHAAYAALGGVEGALSTYADEVYSSLARRDQESVRALFGRLVASDGTRIPLPLASLEPIAAHLIDARLLVVREDDEVDVVEIVHECLATRWQRLARWRSEDASDRALLDDVRAAARRWRDSPELVWRGPLLEQLEQLAARVPLSGDERAFVAASTRASRRARRRRRLVIGGVIGMLAILAGVMAYLGLAADRSRTDAEASAAAARSAASLAEDRLTQALVAQGRRELNDGKAISALAYFAEGLARGVDTPALRFMIAMAERSFRDEKLVLRDRAYTSVATPAAGLVLGDRDGGLTFFGPHLEPQGRLALGIGAVSRIRARGDRLLALGNAKLAIVDRATHTLVTVIAAHTPPAAAHLGPGDDEISSVEHDGIYVYGFDGATRRSVAFDMERDVDGDTMFTTGAKEVVFTVPRPGVHGAIHGANVAVVDLATMKMRTLAEDITAGPDVSDDGALVAYVSRDATVHLLDGALRPIRTFSGVPHPESLLLSRDGARLGLVAERTLTTYTPAGKQLRALVLEPDQSELLIAGDDVWAGGSDGVVRRYHDGILIASLPSHATEITELRLAGELVVTTATDASVVVLSAGARQLAITPRPCEWTSYSPSGSAVQYTCEDGRTFVYQGTRQLGLVHARAAVAAAVLDDRTAIVGDRTLHAFDATGRELAHSDAHTGPLDFLDADHVLVGDHGAWTWTISTNTWQQLRPGGEQVQVARLIHGTLLGDGANLTYLPDDGAARTQAVGDEINFVTTSHDRRWAAVQLGTGSTLIIDHTGAIASRLTTADANGVAAALDPTGDLVIRASAGYLTVWDRATGDKLLFKLELMRSVTATDLVTPTWSRDGRIELTGHEIAVLDIPRETRPVVEILRTIRCRVPLEIVDGRIRPTTMIPPGC